ncbi:MAG: thioredoxin [Oscillospiraceae bacterium]|nr:thioredoxin [Oscillospiraceae bacterium]
MSERPNEIIEITEQNYDSVCSSGKILIDFWATWCMPCRRLSPVIDEISSEVTDGLKVGKINVDDQPRLAEKFSVMSIPTIVVLSDGVESARSVGVIPKSKIIEMIV